VLPLGKSAYNVNDFDLFMSLVELFALRLVILIIRPIVDYIALLMLNSCELTFEGGSSLSKTIVEMLYSNAIRQTSLTVSASGH